jgi:iduronate 2-sulfatase
MPTSGFPALLRLAGVSLIALALGASASSAAPARPNVLFIAIDDLRPALGCYGDKQVKTPHIDRLAAQGVVFTRAYCQVPVCGASRASLMTGILPLPNRFTTHLSRADEDAPGAATLPQVFREAGYTTVSNGKVFHNSADTRDRSWSEPPSGSGQGHSASLDPAAQQTKSAAGRTRIYEAPDVPDNAYGDGKVAEKTIADLQRLKAAGKPFFLACGFIRPHLPFYAPKKYWDLYDRSQLVIAPNRQRPADAPTGLRASGEYRSYAFGDYQDGTEEFHRMMRHGYYASTSYVDQLVGDVLASLARLGLADNTIVVLWGDHGWNLGEHDFWGKHNTLNPAIRIPLIVKAPGRAAGKKSGALVGTYDIFPTLCTLAGLPVPATVQGRGFAALLADPKQAFRESVYSRFGKGDAVVTDRFIYTSYGADGEMLYDLAQDPGEDRNLAGVPAHRATLTAMRGLLAAHQKLAASAAVPPPRPPAAKKRADPADL